MLPLNDRGYEVAYALALAAFLVALVFGFLRISSTAKTILALTYPVAAVVFLIVHDPYGLNFLAWFAVLTVGGVGWVLGLLVAYAVGRSWRFINRNADPSSS